MRRMTNELMTNAELMTNDEKTERELDADRFIIWVSSFLRHSSFVLRHFSAMHSLSARRIASLSAPIFLPMNTSSVRSNSNGSSSQRPATKLKSCAPSAKRMKPFARTTLAGRPFAKLSKESREQILLEVNAKDSNSG